MSILVTGGSSGIGRAVALRFSTPGNDVFVNYHADDRAAEETAKEVEAKGANPHLVKADVGTPEGAHEALGHVAGVTDRLDQLVHCAATAITGPVLEVDPHDLTRAVNLNGTALVYLVQAALPLLGEGSSVLFLSSRGSRVAVPNYAALGAAKALGEALVRYLAVELAGRGVRANTVSAGALDTRAFRAMFPDTAEARLKAAAEANPSGRGLEFDDVVGLVEFLAGPEAAMIQGQVVMVDGGFSLK